MKRNAFSILIFLITQIIPYHLIAQKVHTTFENPSFEEVERNSLKEWKNCNFKNYSRVKFHSEKNRMKEEQKTTQNANDGEKYLSMLVKEDGTWQSITQMLSKPLKRNRCYSFSIHLSTSSELKNKEEIIPFKTPIILRVWGGVERCFQTDLLAETTLVNHLEWKEYTFTFSPNDRIESIQLEAFYDTGINKTPPNGNILLDNLSPIFVFKCKDVDSLSTIKYEYDPPEIVFKRLALQKGRWINFKGKYVADYSMQFLLDLGEAFTELENKKLVICVYAITFDLATERGKDISYILRTELGIKKNQLLIGNYLDFNSESKWIYSGNNINIGLIDLE